MKLGTLFKILLHKSASECNRGSANIIIKIKTQENSFKILGLLIYIDKLNLSSKYFFFFKVNKKKSKLNKFLEIKIPVIKLRVKFYHANIKYSDLDESPIHNKVALVLTDKNGFGIYKRIKFNFLRCGTSNFLHLSSNKIIYYETTIRRTLQN